MERHKHFGAGHGSGVLIWLDDVAIFGERVAYYLSNENDDKWTAAHDLMVERDIGRALGMIP